MNNDGLVFSFRKETIGFTQFDVLMSNDQDILIKQRIDALIEVYDEVNGDELKMAIRRLTRHVSSAREKNQDVGND